jgi:hypothetical protein
MAADLAARKDHRQRTRNRVNLEGIEALCGFPRQGRLTYLFRQRTDAMTCPRCAAESPTGKAYCADCGSPLDAADEKIRAAVQAAIRDTFKDQRLLPIEIAEKAVERFWFYGKIVAIPTTVLLIVLGVLGVSTYRDALRTIQTSGQRVVANLQEQAAKDADKISQTTNAVLAKLNQAESKNLPEQVGRLAEQVSTATRGLQTVQQVVQQAAKTGKDLQDTQALALQYQEEVSRLRTSIVASPPLPTAIGTVSGVTIPGLTGLGLPSTTPALLAPSAGIPRVVIGADAFTDRPPGTLTIGDKGEYVKRAQAKLRELGCYNGDITGTFDEITKEAVVRFKKVPYVPTSNFLVSPSTTGLSVGVGLGTGITSTSSFSGTEPTGDIDYLTWFDLMGSAFVRRCN